MKLLTGFYIFVLITSLITIQNNLNNLLNPVIIVSLIGVLSSILFFVKKTNFYFLAIIWIVIQIPYLKFGSFIFDFSQFLHLHFSINIGSFSLGLNVQVLLLLFLKTILLSRFLYQRISFKAFSHNPKLKRGTEYSFIPTDIISDKLVGDSELEIENLTYSKVEFQPKKSKGFKKAGVILSNLDKKESIKATVEYKHN